MKIKNILFISLVIGIEISLRYVSDMNACTNYISDVPCNSDAAIN